jgi:hypothetical protein
MIGRRLKVGFERLGLRGHIKDEERQNTEYFFCHAGGSEWGKYSYWL